MVLDPFCGCATTLLAAERLGRKWAGIDLSPLAVMLVADRLKRERKTLDLTARIDVPRRTDAGPVRPYRTHKNTLYGWQQGDCNGCGVHFGIRNLTIDRVIPRSRGGTGHLENLQLLCGACNSTKGDGSQAQLLATLRARGIPTMTRLRRPNAMGGGYREGSVCCWPRYFAVSTGRGLCGCNHRTEEEARACLRRKGRPGDVVVVDSSGVIDDGDGEYPY